MSPIDKQNKKHYLALTTLDQQPDVREVAPVQIWVWLTSTQQQTVVRLLAQIGRCLTQACEEVNSESV